MRRVLLFLAVLLVVPHVAGAVPASEHARVVSISGTVTRVVDGDTIHIKSRGFDTTVRLIGIDTPETVHPSKPVQCWGPQASARAKRLMPVGAKVRVVSDSTQDARDRYIDRPQTRPGPTPAPSPRSGCDPNYVGACVPVYPPDVNCKDIGREVQVVGSDPHKLDGDGNGWACEGYG